MASRIRLLIRSMLKRESTQHSFDFLQNKVFSLGSKDDINFCETIP